MNPKIGICKACGERAWESDSIPKDRSGVRGQFLLADGSVADMTLCESCNAELPEGLDGLWERILGTFKADERTDRGWLARSASGNFILCKLAGRSWAEVALDMLR